MSIESIKDTISEMRSVHEMSTDARFAYYVNRSDIKNWADRIESAVADILAENERLKSDVRELLKCLQTVYDEECTDYGTGEVFDRIEAKMNGGVK